MLIWNVNWTSANDRGVKEVLIEYSSNGGTTYDPLPNMNDDDLGNVTVAKTPVDGSGYTLGPSGYQADVDFGGATADHVRMSVQSNWGGVVSALSEVRFYAVPEPSTLVGLIALGLLCLARRRRP